MSRPAIRPAIHLRVPPGIGDFLWLWMKLCGVAADYEIRLSTAVDGGDETSRRSHPFFDLLPGVTDLGQESGWTTPQCVEQTFPVDRSFAELLEVAQARPTFLSPNHWLERGNRIEDMLPDLETNFRPPILGKPAHQAAAASMLPDDPQAIPIAVYVSAHGPVRHWGFWEAEGWLKLIDLVEAALPVRPTWVVIGAKFDHDLTMDFIRGLRYRNANVVNQLGMHIGVAVELIRRCRYLFGFPSGIPILSGLLGVPTMMFFPPELERMRYSFVEPEDGGTYRSLHLPFVLPEQAFEQWTARARRFVVAS